MRIFDFYLFKNLSVATIFVALILVTVIFLTQSLRFLELVINSGASGITFWILTLLALPRFFEVILPLALMTAILFIYNRMTMDSELIVARASGKSHLHLAQPAIILSLVTTVFILSMTLFLAPLSLNQMQKMQNVIKAQFSSFIFREQVFNPAGSGLTFYVRERDGNGLLKGLMIHDTRDKTVRPTTILAQSGEVSLAETGYQITVYDGSRQSYDPQTGTLQKLNFERYNIDLPDSNQVQNRWREPDERSIIELFHPDMDVLRDRENIREFNIEIHKRVTSPLLALAFGLIAVCALILGPVDRRGQSLRIIIAILACIVIQALYLMAFNAARKSDFGLILMYVLPLMPIGFCLFLLCEKGEKFRRRILRRQSQAKEARNKEPGNKVSA